MYERTNKNSERGFIIISVLLFLFCFLKVLRGANTSSTAEGGIWNYISLLYYVFAVCAVFKQRVFKVKAVFVAPLIYCIISMGLSLASGSVSLNQSSIYIFLMIPYFFLVFVSVYLYSSENPKAEKILLSAYLVCLAVNAYTTIAFLVFGRARAVASDVYFSLCLLPFALLFVKNKYFKIAIVTAQFFVSFLSDKRTGFVALCLGLVLYYLIEARNSDIINFPKVFGRIISIVIAMVVLYRISYYIDANFGYGLYNRLNSMIEDEGSGRGAMYIAIWNSFLNSDWLQKLFGHGMNTAGDIVGAGYVHNDFLEILYDYGLIAFLCIVSYYFSIIREAITMIKRKSPYASAFAFSVVVGLSLSMFSYFLIFYTFVTCIAAFWGYVLRMENDRLQNRRLN